VKNIQLLKTPPPNFKLTCVYYIVISLTQTASTLMSIPIHLLVLQLPALLPLGCIATADVGVTVVTQLNADVEDSGGGERITCLAHAASMWKGCSNTWSSLATFFGLKHMSCDCVAVLETSSQREVGEGGR
jgi:hypothetical protein